MVGFGAEWIEVELLVEHRQLAVVEAGRLRVVGQPELDIRAAPEELRRTLVPASGSVGLGPW